MAEKLQGDHDADQRSACSVVVVGDRRTMSVTLPAGLTGPVQVALARAVEQIPRAGALPAGCRFEPKWDGFRLIVTRDQHGVNLWSRRGTNLSTTFPEITSA